MRSAWDGDSCNGSWIRVGQLGVLPAADRTLGWPPGAHVIIGRRLVRANQKWLVLGGVFLLLTTVVKSHRTSRASYGEGRPCSITVDRWWAEQLEDEQIRSPSTPPQQSWLGIGSRFLWGDWFSGSTQKTPVFHSPTTTNKSNQVAWINQPTIQSLVVFNGSW